MRGEVSILRLIAAITAFVLLASGPALAVAPMTAATVKAAQDYGRKRADYPLAVFLQPWTVYEERAAKRDDTAERAYLYTPFLLVAADARDRTAAGGTVGTADGEKVLADYEGYVIFGVTLVGGREDFTGRYVATLRQGRKSVKPSLVHAPPPPADGSEAPCRVLVYFYFPAREVAADRAAKLTVAAAGGRQRSFVFRFGDFR